jgi:hypothetical protein
MGTGLFQKRHNRKPINAFFAFDIMEEAFIMLWIHILAMADCYMSLGNAVICLPISSKKLEFLFGLEGTELLMRPIPSSSRHPGADDVRNAFFTFVHLDERR